MWSLRPFARLASTTPHTHWPIVTQSTVRRRCRSTGDLIYDLRSEHVPLSRPPGSLSRVWDVKARYINHQTCGGQCSASRSISSDVVSASRFLSCRRVLSSTVFVFLSHPTKLSSVYLAPYSHTNLPIGKVLPQTICVSHKSSCWQWPPSP